MGRKAESAAMPASAWVTAQLGGTMLAVRLAAVNDLKLTKVPTPSPGPGEVLVKVGAITLCGTDLRILCGEKTSFVKLPVVLGHETAGHITEVGPA
jgi:L-iditol 2-dehydrogenase